MKRVELKGAGTVSESEAQRNLSLVAEAVERLVPLTTKDDVLNSVNEAWSRGEKRSEASNQRERAITDLRKVIAGEENNG